MERKIYDRTGRMSESGGIVAKCPIHQHCEKQVTCRRSDRKNLFEKRWGGLSEVRKEWQHYDCVTLHIKYVSYFQRKPHVAMSVNINYSSR